MVFYWRVDMENSFFTSIEQKSKDTPAV